MFGNLLMFAKLSLKSFIYVLSETFYFPCPTVKAIYKKCQIEKLLVYHVLTDTDSTSIQFIIVSDSNSGVPEEKIRDVLFEVIFATKIYKCFDTSHPFQDNFQARKKKREKKLGLQKTEHIDNPCYATLVVNLKEYLEIFKDYMTNKNIRVLKKDLAEWNFQIMLIE